MASFEWKVSGSGHEIVTFQRSPEVLDRIRGYSPVLIRPRPELAEPKVIKPLRDVPTLALKFRDLGAVDGNWVAFADAYGLLGLDPVEGGELYDEWGEQIQAVGKVFMFWEIHEERMPWEHARHFVDDVPRIVKLPPERVAEVAVKTTTDGQRYLDLDNPDWHEFPRETSEPSLRERLDAMAPARRRKVLRPWLRQKIAEVVEPNLYKYCGHGFAFSSSGEAAWITQQPRSLLGAIWLQVLWHLTGKEQYRECLRPGCGKWFATDTTKAGRQKWYCGQTCTHAVWKSRNPGGKRQGRKGRR